MAVRIINSFWTSFEQNEKLIKKCMNYLLNRYPDPDGDESAYNLIIERMFELNVFARFDTKKLIAKKLKVAVEDITEDQITEEGLRKAGINIEKKFEQFIFKWVEQILSSAYTARDRYRKRNRVGYNDLVGYRGDGCAYHTANERSKRPSRFMTSWAEDEVEKKESIRHEERRQRLAKGENRGGYLASVISRNDFDDYVGSKFESPDQSAELSSLVKVIRGSLISDREREVLELTLEGYTKREISRKFGCSVQNIHLIMNKIRNRAGLALQNV